MIVPLQILFLEPLFILSTESMIYYRSNRITSRVHFSKHERNSYLPRSKIAHTTSLLSQCIRILLSVCLFMGIVMQDEEVKARVRLLSDYNACY